MKSIYKAAILTLGIVMLYNLVATNTAVTADNKVATETVAPAPAHVHGVHIGMTEHQLWQSMWGKPTSINRTVTENNVREQWVYRGGVKEGYIYLTNGVVTAIQD